MRAKDNGGADSGSYNGTKELHNMGIGGGGINLCQERYW